MSRPTQKKTVLPKQRRTIPLPASDRKSGREVIDAGRYYRCWNCGFVCDIERNELNDTGNGSHPIEYQIPATGAEPGGGTESVTIVVGNVRLSSTDSSGDPVGIQHKFQANGTGCPLCFNRAWKK